MPRVTIAESVSFDTDDKRAQYARLAVYNHGIKMGLYSWKDHSPNTVPTDKLVKAWQDLVGGNYLEGPEGIATISELTKTGAEDKNVQERGLTKAYAQEVRPFIRKGLLSPAFGRRRKAPASVEVQEIPQEKEVPAKKARARRPSTKTKGTSTKMAEARIKHENSVI